jgi:hypothetical protein
MKGLQRRFTNGLVAAGCAGALLAATAAHAGNDHRSFDKIRHVLLISIDGFHAVDLEVCLAKGTCPNLAKLVAHGSTYPNASTTTPSDSFPGLLAQLTGATSKSTGVFYDDSYDRTLFAPAGHPPQPCQTGPGVEVNLAENLDVDLHRIDGGVNAALTGPNSAVAIDPNNLPGQLVKGVCSPLWPHNFVRTNSIFGVIHAHHLRTAWSDKHPAYDIINGNDPDTQPANGPGTNVDEFFAPEINSDLSADNVALVHSLGLKSTAPDPAVTPCPGPNCLDFTGSIDGVEFYDGIKVQAVLNEINGFDHTGKRRMGLPTIFGMNFQAVSVGQKLKIGGYTDPAGTPSTNLLNTIQFADRSIGQMLDALEDNGLAEQTLIIVSAKHGQSPIDRSKRTALDDGKVIAAPIGPNFAFDIADDGALIWLKDNSGTKTPDAVAALNAFSVNNDTGIVQWLSGPLLTLIYQDPAHDSRTPDIIGIARVGVIYTSGSKIAEHGGFNEDDVRIALVVSHPDFDKETVSAAVATAQIAPTILKVLGIDPNELDGVRLENTPVLPDFN